MLRRSHNTLLPGQNFMSTFPQRVVSMCASAMCMCVVRERTHTYVPTCATQSPSRVPTPAITSLLFLFPDWPGERCVRARTYAHTHAHARTYTPPMFSLFFFSRLMKKWMIIVISELTHTDAHAE